MDMPVVDRNSVLKNLRVGEVMRRSFHTLTPEAEIEQAIRFMIKYKVNALLISNSDSAQMGVISKTDVMGAYYAGLALDTPVEAVMVGPPIFCSLSDDLILALESMQTHRVHRVYVRGPDGTVVGVLAYPDIVGLLYRYCQRCDRNRWVRPGQESLESLDDHLKVRDVMTHGICTNRLEDPLSTVIENLSTQKLGAVLVVDATGDAVGVISKTDLMIAYRHGVSIDESAQNVMSRSVEKVSAQDRLMEAVRKMIFSDYHRVFVAGDETLSVIGVLTLSDAARARSGSCHACVVSRVGPQ
jgi:signal-transduction protein with cAMP-binding, CBS, and nucleotidyltransferase domain